MILRHENGRFCAHFGGPPKWEKKALLYRRRIVGPSPPLPPQKTVYRAGNTILTPQKPGRPSVPKFPKKWHFFVQICTPKFGPILGTFRGICAGKSGLRGGGAPHVEGARGGPPHTCGGATLNIATMSQFLGDEAHVCTCCRACSLWREGSHRDFF